MGWLDGKVAIVTGGSRGTGESTARLFAQEGAKVVIGDVLDELGEAVAKDIGDAARYVHHDVSDESSWANIVDLAQREFGKLDVLVNNAAVLHIAAIPDTSVADFERVVRVNQLGTFLGMRAAIEPLKAAGGGSIVNISSIDGRSAKNGIVAYCASKWAVRGMTRVAAIELGKFGIRVNAVCPEAGSGEMMAPYVPEGVDAEVAASFGQPLLRPQRDRKIADRVGDVARMVAFLASDMAASCTGSDFPVDGGNTAGQRVKFIPGA